MRTNRRQFIAAASAATLGAAAIDAASRTGRVLAAENAQVRTVLGPVAPETLGVTLMHEHAPTVDWSELYATPAASPGERKEEMLEYTAKRLNTFHESLEGRYPGPGAIVEVTPIRVGRYPRLLTELARRSKVHVIAATGFWCEALAPQHPWAVRLGVREGGVAQMAELFVREINSGMEDPLAPWGERFTDVKAGIIKIGTSTHLRPSERAVHQAAAVACRETGCPITTHTTDGGGLEQAEFLLAEGVPAKKLIIGHQGYRDDRENEQAHAYHDLIARLGCYLQFDRVGKDNYPIASQAAQIAHLVQGGHANQILLSHDNVPFVYSRFADPRKPSSGWQSHSPDFTVVTRQLVPALLERGVSRSDIRQMLIDNPQRVLAF